MRNMVASFSARYAIRNVLHYRIKYSTAFILIAAFAACLGLALFAFNGFWKQASVYARSWGDIMFSTNPAQLDAAWSSSKNHSGSPPSARLEKEAEAFLKSELKAERVLSAAFIGGDVYAPGGSWSLTVASLDKARQMLGVDLAEGKFPGEGEVLLPSLLRPSLKVGDAITFVYKNTDLIINSLSFRVSGFFLPTSNSSWLMYTTQSEFERLNPGMAPSDFFVFMPRPIDSPVFLSKAEIDKAYKAWTGFLKKLQGSYDRVDAGYDSAENRYAQSKNVIEFFELIISIFLATLVIVALATVVNVLFITVVDRIRIVGTFMAYGMKRGRAIILLASELLVFSFVACSVGLLIAFLIAGPVSNIRFDADNYTIAIILGGKRTLTIIPSFAAVCWTYVIGMILPFLAASIAVAKMIKGEVVGLLHYSK